MSEPTTIRVPVTTSVAESAEEFSATINGRILCLRYEKGTFSDGVGFTLSLKEIGTTIWAESPVNSSKSVYPTQPVQDQSGQDTTQRDYIYAFNDQVKIEIVDGGNSKAGEFFIYYD